MPAVRTYGRQLNQISDANPWSYTIGLTESYGHPDLGDRVRVRGPHS